MIAGLLLLFPLVCALVLFSVQDLKTVRIIALTAAAVEFLISLIAFMLFLHHNSGMLTLVIPWIETWGISLRFGIDGLGLLLILLTTFLTPLILLSPCRYECYRPSAFYGLVMLMEMAFIGVFSARDGLIFYIFWELALIPAYFICVLWGGKDRRRITFKFFIYTFTGSLFMLAALIYLYLKTPIPHSFSLDVLYTASLSSTEQTWVFVAFFLAFAIKIPVFPFHSWQPDTYTESPLTGTMLLSGIMLKMGTYGMMRFMIPLCPESVYTLGPYAIILAVTGIVYASIIAIRQDDLKRLVAFSSIAHVGLISAGILSLTIYGMEGAVIQMISHGINIVGLFFCIDFIERRTGSRDISRLGGLARQLPWFSAVFMVILLASIALPMTNGFIGEFLLLLGIFEYNKILAAVAGLGIIFSAVYMLWMYQRVMLGEAREIPMEMKDVKRSEWLVFIPLIVMIFWIGLFPSSFLNIAEPVINDLIHSVK